MRNVALLLLIAGVACSTKSGTTEPPQVTPDSLERVFNGWLVSFHWTHHDDPDFEYYTVYWGDTSGFDRAPEFSTDGSAGGVPDNGLVTFAEVLPPGFVARYYVVSTTVGGDEGEPSNEVGFIEPTSEGQ
jgi:hypothetical protein